MWDRGAHGKAEARNGARIEPGSTSDGNREVN